MIMPVKATSFTHAMQTTWNFFITWKYAMIEVWQLLLVKVWFVQILAGGTEDALILLNLQLKMLDIIWWRNYVGFGLCCIWILCKRKYDYTKFEGETGKIRTLEKQENI
jgi:enolase